MGYVHLMLNRPKSTNFLHARAEGSGKFAHLLQQMTTQHKAKENRPSDFSAIGSRQQRRNARKKMTKVCKIKAIEITECCGSKQTYETDLLSYTTLR